MRRSLLIPLLALLASHSSFGISQANAGVPGATRVEEDWEVVVATPDLVAAGPQITTTMSPQGDNTESFVSFNLNYRDNPFMVGGLQVQFWLGGTQNTTSNSQRTQQLATLNEKITWTQQMSLSNGTLTYNINNGSSTTWGTFGQGGNLRLNVPSSLTDLSQYDPSITVKFSGVSYQSNLVTSMTLKQIRYYVNNTLVFTDSTPRVIIQP